MSSIPQRASTSLLSANSRRLSGFTIVELLIVIVVIAILAAISIVAYNGIQNRTNDTTIQSDLRNIGSKIIEHSTIYGSLPTTIPEITSLGLKVSVSAYGSHYVAAGADYNMAYCRFPSTGQFAVIAGSKSGNVYMFKDGKAQPGTGPMATIATTCTNNGMSGAATTWFYNAGVWQFGMGS